MPIMKALSIRQPWAWLIVNGYKDIENRTWPTRFRGRVLIHASKAMTRQEYEKARARAERIDPTLIFPDFDALARGGIVGVARITECLKRSDSPWHIRGAWGFKLEGARPLAFKPRKGALGFFDVRWLPKKRAAS
jgi:hypothetical protein